MTSFKNWPECGHEKGECGTCPRCYAHYFEFLSNHICPAPWIAFDFVKISVGNFPRRFTK